MGIIGLGNIGSTIARYAKAFEMEVIAWSENLTLEKANEHGVRLVSKEDLFKTADFVTLHLVLSSRSRNIVTSSELNLMKSTAYLINTSRGPLVNEADLINVLVTNKIAGAALDVYDTEPLPAEHPFRRLDNVLATPHIGYVTKDTYKIFYEDTISRLEEWLS
ncbi:NAD(P)-dependent oxidoreductase [Pedobacter panaciterrae]|uniref:NAD(P)-dependent oxidoreductase n=1 Tax=Pedobacter panaciterrae TaxID=363849 RepID=UPI00293BFB36|nr:NAD(P)-dependent oxidoreductase [Pedobacter panaciterrae]